MRKGFNVVSLQSDREASMVSSLELRAIGSLE